MPIASVKSRGSQKMLSELPLGCSIPSGQLQMMLVLIAVRCLGCSQQRPLGTPLRPRTAVRLQTAHGAYAQTSNQLSRSSSFLELSLCLCLRGQILPFRPFQTALSY